MKPDTFYYFKVGDEETLMRGKLLSKSDGRGYKVEREKNGKFIDFSDAMSFVDLLEKGTPVNMA